MFQGAKPAGESQTRAAAHAELSPALLEG